MSPLEIRRQKAIQLLQDRRRLIIRDCSMCGYNLNFFMQHDKLYIDTGCYCVTYRKYTQRDLSELDLYLNHDSIAKQWGVI